MPLQIVFSGMIAADPHQGGAAWAVLQYVLGLRALGHRVLLIEPVSNRSLRPQNVRLEDSINAHYFRSVIEEFGLEGEAALVCAESQATVGLSYPRLVDFGQHADLLINISGMLADDRICARIPVRAYLDLDPAFVQCWHEQGIDMGFGRHTHFVTVGLGIGDPDCPIPTCGRDWIKTRQPILLRHWPVADRIERNALTTVGNWRGYGSVEHRGVVYGQKAHSLRPLFQLPQHTREEFQLAMSIHPGETADLKALRTWGWKLIDPAAVAATPTAYRAFISGSKAEFGIAKSGYVLSRSGWFSDRSVCYLAAGRPVLAQETGFSRCLPVGEGLFAFTEEQEVVHAIDRLNSNYTRHRNAARLLAEEYFASDRILPKLLDHLGTAP